MSKFPKFKDRLLPSAIAFTADLHFSYLLINRAPKAVDVFTEGISVFHFFYQEVKNLKLCPFVTNDLLQILSTSQTFNYCWPLLKLPLAFLLTSHGHLSLTMVSTKGWRWVFWLCPVILFCYEHPKCYERPTYLLNFCPHHIFFQTNAFLATSKWYKWHW